MKVVEIVPLDHKATPLTNIASKAVILANEDISALKGQIDILAVPTTPQTIKQTNKIRPRAT